jgi:catalase
VERKRFRGSRKGGPPAQRLISNIVGNLGQTPKRIQELQCRYFYKADPAYGTGVAKGLGLDINAILAAEEKSVAAD